MAQEDSISIPNGLIIQTPLVESNNNNNNNNDLPPPKKKRNLPGNPDPEAEVIALSPKTLMATNRFLCEICGKGFQRDQNLQLHRRGHNLPWKLKQRSGKEPRKRVYVCPEKSCVHNHPSRALGDLTGIKKHFCRKHGEKKWKCDKCSKSYAVHSDCKAHSKTCGTREYKCDCGTIFSRRDSFVTHRAFCDALAEESARVNAASHFSLAARNGSLDYNFMGGLMAPQQQQQQNFTLFKARPTKEDHETTMSNINDHHHHTQKGSIPLWIMGQAHHQDPNDVIHQQLGPASNINSFYPCPQSLVPGLSLLQEQQPIQAPENYQNLNWAFGNSNKMCSDSTTTTTGEGQLASTTLPQTMSCSRDQELVGSVPCLYSNQHQTSSSSSHMSATALLQKAAQIGATTTDPFFIGGIKNNDAKNNTNNIVNEAQDHHHHHHQVSKYCGELAGYGSNSTTTNLVGSDMESTTNELSPMNNIAQMEMYSAAGKRRRTVQRKEQINNHYHPYHHQQQQQHNQTGDGGQTRDFLGVGAVESMCHPNSINGWI